MFIVQSITGGRVTDEKCETVEPLAIALAASIMRSAYFEGDRVRVLTEDGELVWDSRTVRGVI